MLILGIDPGSHVTGFGLIESSPRLSLVTAGALRLSTKAPLADRVREAADGVRDLIREHSPREVCLESVFQHANVRSALVLAHVRGALLAEVSRAGLDLHEYSPLEIKKALVGHGRADKEQVRHMVRQLLGLESLPRPHDVSDALAVAICHANTARTLRRWGQ